MYFWEFFFSCRHTRSLSWYSLPSPSRKTWTLIFGRRPWSSITRATLSGAPKVTTGVPTWPTNCVSRSCSTKKFLVRDLFDVEIGPRHGLLVADGSHRPLSSTPRRQSRTWVIVCDRLSDLVVKRVHVLGVWRVCFEPRLTTGSDLLPATVVLFSPFFVIVFL